MKRLFRYVTIALALLTATACEYDTGTEPQPERLAREIWNIARDDLWRVNDALTFAACYNYYLNIEDSETARQYAISKLNNPSDITVDGNIHKIVYNTSYETTYSIIFDMNGERWNVKRTGGNGYELNIEQKRSNYYIVDIEYIYSSESTGYGIVEGTLNYDENGEPEIGFVGSIVMVDKDESAVSPLTITIDIIEEVSFYNVNIIRTGRMLITAEDALYGTKDEIMVTVLRDVNGQAIVEYDGKQWGFYI